MKDILSYAINKKNKSHIFVSTYDNSTKQDIICPYCFGKLGFKKGRAIRQNGLKRASHFFHLVKCSNKKVDSNIESEQHRKAKEYIINVFNEIFKKDRDIKKNIVTNEYYLPHIKRISDVYIDFTYKENNYKKAIEIQYSDIAEEELQQRHNDYYYQGIDDIRIIGLSYDENGYIKNKTLSLLDKILNFQRIIPLIDGEKVYIIKKEKTIKVTTINENNYLITTKTIAFDLFNSLQGVNHLNNLLKLENSDIGKEFFINSVLEIYKKTKEITYKKFITNDINKTNKIDEKKEKLLYNIFLLFSTIDREIYNIKERLSKQGMLYKDINKKIYQNKDSKIGGLFSVILLILKNITNINRKFPSHNTEIIITVKIVSIIEKILLDFKNIDNDIFSEEEIIQYPFYCRFNKYGVFFAIKKHIKYEKEGSFIFKNFFKNKAKTKVHLEKMIDEIENKSEYRSLRVDII